MAQRIERLFAGHGAERMYLTADPVTGRPFWEAMGFRPTGEVSPENRLSIYEKAVDNDRYTILPATPAQAAAVYAIYAASREALHGREIFLNEWRKLLEGEANRLAAHQRTVRRRASLAQYAGGERFRPPPGSMEHCRAICGVLCMGQGVSPAGDSHHGG